MRKMKELKNKIAELEQKIAGIDILVFEDNKRISKIYPNLKKRDELIENKFLGKLTDKRVIEAFKSAVNFEIVKAEIIKYDFTNLDVFLKALKEFERKEEMLNTFRPLAKAGKNETK